MGNDNRQTLANEFILALQRQVQRKSLMRDGIHAHLSPYEWLASIAEELGEVSSDLVRGRCYGAVAECIDVAHSALLLSIELGSTGDILRSLFPAEST